MCHNKKWEKTNNQQKRTTKPKKNQNSCREGRKLQALKNIEREHHQTIGDERKK